MSAKIWIGIKSRESHLRRLSIVFAVELRLKIVTELYMREMSAKQFYEEFGGGSPSRVSRNFERLAEHGWIRYVRGESGGDRRGTAERFYRAPELAYFDSDAWDLLPYSIQVAFSWSSFKQIAERVRETLEALALDAFAHERPLECDLTFISLSLDQQGWKTVMNAIDTQFVGLYEEQNDSRLRVCHSDEQLIRGSVLQIAFEAPTQNDETLVPNLIEDPNEPLIPFPVRLSKVFADEVCMEIVHRANQQEISATRFHAESKSDEPLNSIQRRFKKLETVGWLKEVSQRKRRGAQEKFYRATGPVILDDSGPWADVPPLLKETDSWRTFERLSAHVKEAMKAGTFDASPERYLAWSLLQLDRQGWKKVTAGVSTLLTFALDEQERAKARMRDSAEQPITLMVGLGAFDSVKEPDREP